SGGDRGAAEDRRRQRQSRARAGHYPLMTPPMAEPALRPEEYRSRFPILAHTIHLGNCSQGPLSLDVREALERYQQSLLSEGMAWETWVGEVQEARGEFARLIGAAPDDVAVLSCVSDAISTIASCLPF